MKTAQRLVTDGRRFRRPVATCAIGLALAGMLAGCAPTRRAFYLDTEANFAAVQKIALLPFDNFTSDPHAPDKLGQILEIELLSARAFELTDPGDVRRAMSELEIGTAGKLPREKMQALGERLQVQALLLGTVQELSLDRTAGVSAPTISLHFELVDVATGQKVWSSVVSRQGTGAMARLFGIGGTGTNEALQDLVNKALRTLIK